MFIRMSLFKVVLDSVTISLFVKGKLTAYLIYVTLCYLVWSGFPCVTFYRLCYTVLPVLYVLSVLSCFICVTLCYLVLSVLHIPNSDHPVCLKDDPGSGGESSGLLLSTTESVSISCKFLLCEIQISLTTLIASRQPLIYVQLRLICICIIFPNLQI